MKRLILKWWNYILTKKSLLFVESPLQLLNAYEAVSYFDLENYIYLVRFSYNEANDQQIINLLYLLKINTNNIKHIYLRTIDRTLCDYSKLFFYRFKYVFIKNIDKIFIGNYESNFFKLIIKQFSKENIILLDDGAKTLSIQSQFTNTKKYNLFTMYDIKALENQKIYINSYRQVLSKIKNLSIKQEEILFLGTKLSEAEIIEEGYYIKLIQNICNYYSDKKIVYIVHRGESQEKLELIQKNENILIKQLDYPIELYGLYENKMPFKVSSFYSTALLTMNKIYNLEAECFKFNYSNSIHVSVIDEVYSFYQKEMKVINLDD